ncbi:hypothetical protein MAPG_06115 [Magnaporthiopsis poae ATCC 64411]|uniref:Uncharacterized protein n=1 Tax=Magnaporthiopsis poae (strain ATCC 64411 / 73-15) TaxID=644358 RepID=A0A0C4E166_MAGP6|nr:hypothetical protein MAPG_06115 [Magnaporthiopsis poae ATCC 64411]
MQHRGTAKKKGGLPANGTLVPCAFLQCSKQSIKPDCTCNSKKRTGGVGTGGWAHVTLQNPVCPSTQIESGFSDLKGQVLSQHPCREWERRVGPPSSASWPKSGPFHSRPLRGRRAKKKKEGRKSPKGGSGTPEHHLPHPSSYPYSDTGVPTSLGDCDMKHTRYRVCACVSVCASTPLLPVLCARPTNRVPSRM